jgi:DNA-binding ferritin-like protein
MEKTMKILKRDLGSLLKGIKLLAERSDKIAERFVKLEGSPTEKPKARKKVRDPEKGIIKKARNQTAVVKVLGVIESSKGGLILHC